MEFTENAILMEKQIKIREIKYKKHKNKAETNKNKTLYAPVRSVYVCFSCHVFTVYIILENGKLGTLM